MLRHAAHRLASRAAAGSISRRALATAQVPAESGEDPAFVESWKKVTNIIDPPQTPMAAMKPRPPTPASIPSKLTVNFVLPYKSEISNKEVYSIYSPEHVPLPIPDLCVCEQGFGVVA
jgi:F-type H+-transporting ATPase subunit delta